MHTQNMSRVLNRRTTEYLTTPKNTKTHVDSSTEGSKLIFSSLYFSSHLEGEMGMLGFTLPAGVKGSQPWDLLLPSYIHIKCIAFMASDPQQ